MKSLVWSLEDQICLIGAIEQRLPNSRKSHKVQASGTMLQSVSR